MPFTLAQKRRRIPEVEDAAVLVRTSVPIEEIGAEAGSFVHIDLASLTVSVLQRVDADVALPALSRCQSALELVHAPFPLPAVAALFAAIAPLAEVPEHPPQLRRVK